MRTFLALVAVALFASCNPQGCQAVPPGGLLSSLQAVPAQSGGKWAGHSKVSCTSTATTLANFAVADASGNANGYATEFFFYNPSATVTVRLISQNGEAEASGMPFCDAAGCVRGMSIPTPVDRWKCKSDGAAVDVFLLGLRFE